MNRSSSLKSLPESDKSEQSYSNATGTCNNGTKKYQDYDTKEQIQEDSSISQTRTNSPTSLIGGPMFVRRSCKPELFPNTKDSDLEIGIELILAKNNEGIYLFSLLHYC